MEPFRRAPVRRTFGMVFMVLGGIGLVVSLTLLFLYGALLHGALIAAGCSWWRPEEIPTPAEPELSPSVSALLQ